MEVLKSPRHSKITGDFAERLILYWLSKYGFECAYVDHVGLDIIARTPRSREMMGISVKSRSRNTGKEGSSLNIPNDNLAKLDAACGAFDCKPYFAIVIDEADAIRAYILSKSHLISLHPPGDKVMAWAMGEKWTARYAVDPLIMTFTFNTKTGNWWPSESEMQNAP
jgi:hypothetical protein